jgi:hypothetical protein
MQGECANESRVVRLAGPIAPHEPQTGAERDWSQYARAVTHVEIIDASEA